MTEFFPFNETLNDRKRIYGVSAFGRRHCMLNHMKEILEKGNPVGFYSSKGFITLKTLDDLEQFAREWKLSDD